MANKGLPCSICSAPDNGRGIVDDMLQKQVAMKEIAKVTGFSKSSVHRHSAKCVRRQAAETLKRRRHGASGEKLLWTRRLDGSFRLWPPSPRFQGPLPTSPQAGDTVLTVVFAPAVTIETARNPDALLSPAEREGKRAALVTGPDGESGD